MMHMTPTSAYITKEDINLLACNFEITWSAYVDIPNPIVLLPNLMLCMPKMAHLLRYLHFKYPLDLIKLLK